MISFVEGTIEFKAEKFVIINVAGIGYKVFSNPEILSKISEKGANVKLWTHQYVREDALELYGFLHFAELELFETLITISGIGPKGALGVLEIAPVDTLKKAIASGDTSYLTRVSGIGRKTAEKIVLELRDKMGTDLVGSSLQGELDVLEALKSLGYSQNEVREALKKVSPDTDTNAKIREALKILGK